MSRRKHEVAVVSTPVSAIVWFQETEHIRWIVALPRQLCSVPKLVLFFKGQEVRVWRTMTLWLNNEVAVVALAEMSPPHWSRSPYIENQTARTPQVLSLLSPSLNWFSIQTYGSKVSVLSDSVYVVHRSRGEGDWTLGWNKVGKAVSNLKPPPFFSPCFQC